MRKFYIRVRVANRTFFYHHDAESIAEVVDGIIKLELRTPKNFDAVDIVENT
jgi:hypothetical protein